MPYSEYSDFKPGDVVCLNMDALRGTFGAYYSPQGAFVEDHEYVVRSICPSGYDDHGGTLYVVRDSQGSTTNGWAVQFFKPVKPAGGPW